jgi:hypothetical protein
MERRTVGADEQICRESFAVCEEQNAIISNQVNDPGTEANFYSLRQCLVEQHAL